MKMIHKEEMLSYFAGISMLPRGKEGLAVKGKKGSELVDGLVIEEGDYKLVKTRFSAFFATHLDSFLKSNGVDSLVVTGEW